MKTRTIVAAACVLGFAQPAFARPPLVLPTGFGPASASSWVAGAVAGYNWQRGSVVFGFEGDLSGTDLRSESTGGFSSPINNINFTYPTGDVVAKVDWYGTARARLGWAQGPFLLYGTAGLAYGHASLNTTYNLGTVGQNNALGPLTAQTSPVQVGWVAGGGVEYLLTSNLSLNLEYQYVDLGTLNQDAPSATIGRRTITGPGASAHAEFQVVTLGVSWHFGAPSPAPASTQARRGAPVAMPPSNPWEGLYVGGRAGGAWGNKLDVTPPTTFLPPA
ncbi:MAG: outer membrane beta-barrel protein [Xanthobacteraceae bacterium]|nr:outer membrane beta-barrel protein [Xanthobacteraceae bacterium]